MFDGNRTYTCDRASSTNCIFYNVIYLLNLSWYLQELIPDAFPDTYTIPDVTNLAVSSSGFLIEVKLYEADIVTIGGLNIEVCAEYGTF